MADIQLFIRASRDTKLTSYIKKRRAKKMDGNFAFFLKNSKPDSSFKTDIVVTCNVYVLKMHRLSPPKVRIIKFCKIS